MTVLEKKAASGVDGRKIGQYVAVALLAGALGVAGVIGLSNVAEPEGLSPTEIAEIRAGAQVDYHHSQWLARVNAQRNAEVLDYFAGLHAANVQRIQSQRAEGMVDYFSNQNRARVARIQEQRAAAMVEFEYGWGR